MNDRSELDFLGKVSPKVLQAMYALGAAESLTDYVAEGILRLSGIPESGVPVLLALLHCADYVAPRNSEWHFIDEVRVALRDSAREADTNLEEIHRFLLEIGKAGDKSLAGDIIPAYLFTHAGRAFHLGELGDTHAALEQYSYAATSNSPGELWLGGSLAQEQQAVGTLPPDALEPRFLRALAAYRDGELDEAMLTLTSIAKSDQRHELVAWALHLIGSIRIRQGQAEVALNDLGRAIQLYKELGIDRRLPAVLRVRALAFRKLEKFQEALDDLKDAISLSHGDFKASLLTIAALINRKIGNDADAMGNLDDAEKIATIRVLPLVLIQRANLKRDSGDYNGALIALDAAIPICRYERLAIVLHTRAVVLRDMGEVSRALDDIAAAIQVCSPSSRAAILNTRSTLYRDEGEFELAIADNEEILAMQPELLLGMNLIKVNQRTSEMRKKQRKLAAAQTESDVSHFWWAHFLAVAKLAKNAPYRVAAYAQKALDYARTDDERFRCYLSTGQAFERAQLPGLALPALREAKVLKPDSSVATATLAHVMDLLGNSIDESEPYFIQAMKADLENMWAKSWYALALSRAGRHDEAIKLARTAANDEQCNAVLIFNFATVLFASPKPAHRRLAIKVAKEAARLAFSSFRDPEIFLAKNLPTLSR